MKTIRYILAFSCLCLLFIADAQQLRQRLFELINLDYPGLEKVKAACSRQEVGGGSTGTVELLP